MPTWRELLFGCIGAVMGAAAVGIASSRGVLERHSVGYDECLAHGRSKSACDVMERVVKARHAREECLARAGDNPFKKEDCEASYRIEQVTHGFIIWE